MKGDYGLIMGIVISACLVNCDKPNTKGIVDSSPNKITVDKLFEAFNKHDWNAYADFYSENAEFLDPSYGKEYVKQTHQQLVEKYKGFQEMSPDIKDEVGQVYVAGERVIVEFVAEGTAPDGTKWKLPICSVLTFKDGKIIRDATYFDNEQ